MNDNQIGNTIFSGPLGEPLTFGEFILLATSIVLFLGFILAIVFILWGGLLLILSGGKEEKTKPAINTIRYAILGIFITVGVIFIAPILGDLLGMGDIVREYFSINKIYENITNLSAKLFGGGVDTTNSTRYINNKGGTTNLDDLDF